MKFHFPNIRLVLSVVISTIALCHLGAKKLNASDLPDFSTFHSNLGVQEIVELGVPVEDLKKTNLTPSFSPPSAQPERKEEWTQEEAVLPSQKPSRSIEVKKDEPGIWERGEAKVPSTQPPAESGSSPSGFQISAQSGLRAYHTSNVLRQSKENEERSGVFEANVMASVRAPDIEVGDYYILLPRFDMMLQWAQYQERSDLLDYRFGMIKGGVGLAMPNDWNLGFGLDYNILHNMRSRDKTFDAWSPSFTMHKGYAVFKNSYLMFDATARISNVAQTQVFEAAGIFADSGDNVQNSISLTLVHPFDEEGKVVIMPRIGLSRTNYYKFPNKHRLDYLFSGGANVSYRWRDHIDLQGFMSFSSMSSNDINDFEAYDLGLALSGNYRF